MEEEIIDEKKVILKGEITKEDLLNTYKKNIIRSGLSFSIIGSIISILGISFLIASIVNKDKTYTIYGLFMFVIGLLIVALPFLFLLVIPKLMANQNKGLINGFKYKYVFNNENVSVVLSSDEAKTNTSFSYSIIYKAKMFGDVACIYINSNVVYMFNVNAFENDEDRNYVMSKLDKKYKVKNNE